MDHDHPRTAKEAALEAAKSQSSHEPPVEEIADPEGAIVLPGPLLGRMDDEDDGASSLDEVDDSDASELDSQNPPGNADDGNALPESGATSADFFDPAGADVGLDDVSIVVSNTIKEALEEIPNLGGVFQPAS